MKNFDVNIQQYLIEAKILSKNNHVLIKYFKTKEKY